MAKLSLKNIISKKNEINDIVLAFTSLLNSETWVEDETGKSLLGNPKNEVSSAFPITLEDEVIGWVKGDEKAIMIANLLTHLSKKEAEKKKLGGEVLNLYQEINLIYNFSEKLAQVIEPAAIAQLTLNEAMHSIPCDSGVIVLWDEELKQLQTPATYGERLFNEENLIRHANLLLKIGLSGQSEIMSEVSTLTQTGIIRPDVQSIIYAALKVKHRIMGAIILASKEKIQYSAGNLKLLVTLALQSSSAIESALQYEKNIREAKEREEALRRIYDATEKFVPIEFLASLGHDVITDVRLGDQVEKIVTVLFSDIRDYTKLSEQMTPEENFRFVCSFNEHLGPLIRKHKGFINQYLGDGIMAIFPHNAVDALGAAVEMQKAVIEFNAHRILNNQLPIKIGIGMHSGPLIMGITGDNNRMDATTISDTVNAASRIESLTKYYKSNIIISDATLAQISNAGRFHLRPLGLVLLKGKREPLGIHECFSGNSEEELQRKIETVSTFKDGISNYLNKSFSKAFIDFQNVLETNPADHTANFFLSKAARYITSGVPENWTGVEEMVNK